MNLDSTQRNPGEFHAVFINTGPETRPVMSVPHMPIAADVFIREVAEALGIEDTDRAREAADWIAGKLERYAMVTARPVFDMRTRPTPPMRHMSSPPIRRRSDDHPLATHPTREDQPMTPPMQVPLPPTSKGLLDCSTDVDSKAIARGDLSAERLGGMLRVSENSYAVWVQHLREEGQAMTETPILCPQCDHDIDAHDAGLSQRCYPEGVSYCWCRLAPSEIARDLLRHDTSHRPLAPIPGAIYLAGPMSGVPENNYPAFHAAAAKLRAEGHVVLSPAEHTETADTWAGWMRLGLAMLIQCDTIVLLPGWQESRGAKIEAKLAADLGMASYHYPTAPDPDEQRVTRDAGADR